jgi:hypothetical protein
MDIQELKNKISEILFFDVMTNNDQYNFMIISQILIALVNRIEELEGEKSNGN